ncbi:MAG: hypothetical protein WBP45_11535 [Daejeonella sp.]
MILLTEAGIIPNEQDGYLKQVSGLGALVFLNFKVEPADLLIAGA